MTRLVALAFLSILIAAPTQAQVINGETPLDETRVAPERPGQAEGDRSATRSPLTGSTTAPARTGTPPSGDDRRE